ncbi:MAG: nucleotidyltransferase domain-containing protein [bacterium]
MIKGILEKVVSEVKNKFKDNLIGIILYGSWAKGTAKEDSDIDLLAVFDKIDNNIVKTLYKIESSNDSERSITIVPASKEDFQKEKNPLFTAVKKEGKIIWGNVNLAINSEPPEIKYADYFKKSKEVETKKVEMAEGILKESPDYGSAVLCFVASKHAIQMALAMKGLGYSSKVAVLLPLVKEHISIDVAMKFKKLFEFYIKSEYGMEFLTEDEARLAIEYAKSIIDICYGIET